MAETVEKYNDIAISVDTKDMQTASAIANMTVPYGIYTEDYSSLEEEVQEIAHINLIDEKLLQKDKSKCIIHVYISVLENPNEALSFIKERLESEKIPFSYEIKSCDSDDWQNNWKQYFHTFDIGEKLTIRPIWEQSVGENGRKVLNIEPGLAFGTGSHPTTKLCLEVLEKYVKNGSKVLDIGCGSGILSIASLLLGADSALATDIDPIAVKTSKENAKLNGFVPPVFDSLLGDLSDNVKGKYDIIVANIVADTIIKLNQSTAKFLCDDGIYITGGIIKSREGDVLSSFEENAFKVLNRYEEKGWLVFVLTKQSQP